MSDLFALVHSSFIYKVKVQQLKVTLYVTMELQYLFHLQEILTDTAFVVRCDLSALSYYDHSTPVVNTRKASLYNLRID